MTPQSSFMIAAPIRVGAVAELRALLESMNLRPGMADPANPLVPFGRLPRLHFARFAILDDQTLSDRTVAEPAPLYLTFLGDIDGESREFLELLEIQAGDGLRRIFSFCEGFGSDTNLHDWMISHQYQPATFYCNVVGRTARQVREEETLRLTLRSYIDRNPWLRSLPPQEARTRLRDEARQRVPLTPPGDTPFFWALRHVFDIALFAVLVILGIVTLPLTIIPLLIVARKLRGLEKTDPEMIPRPDPAWAMKLAAIEDFSVTNQFTAMGTLKPGKFRRRLLRAILFLIDLTTRTIFTRGRLARVSTIHFARWVYLDGGRRLLFCSNYDGSLDNYMDDFINKVAFGLNAVFSNGIGYPRTRWLLFDGAKNEQAFKYFIRRHQLPTEVWYNAHEGLTAYDRARNSRIRRGVDALNMKDTEIVQWLALL